MNYKAFVCRVPEPVICSHKTSSVTITKDADIPMSRLTLISCPFINCEFREEIILKIPNKLDQRFDRERKEELWND